MAENSNRHRRRSTSAAHKVDRQSISSNTTPAFQFSSDYGFLNYGYSSTSDYPSDYSFDSDNSSNVPSSYYHSYSNHFDLIPESYEPHPRHSPGVSDSYPQIIHRPQDEDRDQEVGEDEYEDEEEEYEICGDVFGLEDFSEESDESSESTISSLTKNLGSVNLSVPRLMPPKIVESQYYAVLVDGYYRERHSKGGFGVVILDRTGAPVAGLSGFSEPAVSEFHHTLEGVRAGLELVARISGIRKIHMACNNDVVVQLVSLCMISHRVGCFQKYAGGPNHDYFDGYCLMCCAMEGAKHCEILKDIVKKSAEYSSNCGHGKLLTKIFKQSNKAADYLAKRLENKVYDNPGKLPKAVIMYLGEFGGGAPLEIKPALYR